jgi:hypothetical protein
MVRTVRGAPGRHGVDGVGQQIDEHLFDLVAVEPDGRQVGGPDSRTRVMPPSPRRGAPGRRD